ncbi:response regulator transcription factor [Azospirillum sp. RWY-5-1]|uniref:Response regulator transcription factor n=1 Tax=Azospirillum oleiclasticum TaxID=2735135 RepID=A0ABX2T7F4_9PROT|nr:response regulator transcription factor [Azospirillum oleiclasticum]NYZ11444.1 response regulator transcription factor [Azospirillum oleiclasticum]NYZ18605.1 response regulator transcription factor [Azospirillum oleiclasticum]
MRILLIEDDPLIGDAIRTRLTRAGMTVDWLEDGASLDGVTELDAFDLMVLDLGLPDCDGLDILHRQRADGHGLPILILSARYELDSRVRGLDLGADDYLVKPFAMEELMARCRALARRRGDGRPGILHYRDLRIDPASLAVLRGADSIALTPKVFALLLLFVENQGRVLTRNALENHLYGWSGEAESNTLEVFVSQIRRKLGADLIQTIRGVGYMLPKE